MKLFKRFGDKAKGRFHRGIERFGDKRKQTVLEPISIKDVTPPVKAAVKPATSPSGTQKPSTRRRRSTKAE